MISVSLCMIVKNEEAVLERCLKSVQNLVDEIIIVDTGSTDCTKQIAQKFTRNVYDFTWNGDFSAARNFAFSKATKDYIYSADADEVLDADNQERFLQLKQVMLPEIEIVQMVYITDMEFNTTENYVRDYRPKMFKRLRTFQWIEPVHEMVNMNPVVFDSEVEIKHLPIGKHQKRDFSIFEKTIKKEGKLSERLTRMYARELYFAGELEDFAMAEAYFYGLYEDKLKEQKETDDLMKIASCILCKYAYLSHNDNLLTKISLQDMSSGGSAEVCMQLGNYYFDQADFSEALKWYQNAATRTESFLDIHSSTDQAFMSIAKTLECLGANEDEIQVYKQKAQEFTMSHRGA